MNQNADFPIFNKTKVIMSDNNNAEGNCVMINRIGPLDKSGIV